MVVPNRGLTFVEADIQSLERAYRIEVLTRRDHPSRRSLVSAMLRRLLCARYAALLVWFAEPHDSPWVIAAARLLRTRTLLIVGGYEVAWLPALDYGALGTRRGRLQVRAALHAAHEVLPTSRLLAAEIGLLGRTRGVEVIPPGIDCDLFQPGTAAREALVVTVGTVSPSTVRLKGLDVFARCARLVPEARFAILGPCTDAALAAELRALGGPNLTIDGCRLRPEELVGWYQRARVYAQLSARESFGVALAEAMACGCTPVVSSVGSLPEVAGEAGFLVDSGDASAAAAAIRRALAVPTGDLARRRIQGRYALETRTRALLAVVGAGARGLPVGEGR